MDPKLDEIIRSSSFNIEDGEYIYASVKTAPSIEDHFLITKDEDEVTVVTRAENIEKLDLIERNRDNYRLIALNVLIPFYSVGFLATVSSKIAENGMNILIVSTYSKDYILVRADLLDEATKALLDLGFTSDGK